MPVRFDRHVGSIEILEPERSTEGFLKMCGIALRTGVLHYQDDAGNVRGELIPPEELFKPESIATLGGKPFTDDHPRNDDGAPILVTPENSKEHTRGTIGNDIKGDVSLGLVRITLDAHQAGLIGKIDGGKRELSSGRTIERIDETPGVWDPKTQQYWTGAEAKGRKGVRFDAIQRGFVHNHVALVDRGRAGNQVAIRMDSGDAVQVEPPKQTGGLPMAKVRIDGAEYEVDSGAAAAITRYQEGVKARTDGHAEKVTELEARLVKADAALAVEQVKATELQTKFDAVDVRASVVARLALERSVAHLKIDGADAMSDRELQVAAIKTVKADYDDTGLPDDHVQIYFDAMRDLMVASPSKRNDGAAGLNTARHDGSGTSDIEAARTKWANRGSFAHRNKEA